MTTLHEQIHKEMRSVKLTRAERERMLSALRAHMGVREATYEGFSRMLQIRFIAPALAALVLMLGGSASYAAESALPGDLLYPIKVEVNEEVRAAFNRTPEAEASWNVVRAERRLEEASTLAVQGVLSPALEDELLARFTEHAASAFENIDTLDEGAPGALAASFELEDSVSAHEEILLQAGEENQAMREIAERFVSRVREATAPLERRTFAFERSDESRGVSTALSVMAPEAADTASGEPVALMKAATPAPEPLAETGREISTASEMRASETYRTLAEQMKALVEKRLKRALALAEDAKDSSSLNALERAQEYAENGKGAFEEGVYEDSFEEYREALSLLVRTEARLKLEQSRRSWESVAPEKNNDESEVRVLERLNLEERLDRQGAGAGDVLWREEDEEDSEDADETERKDKESERGEEKERERR